MKLLLIQPKFLQYLLPLWPPYWGTGIRIDYVASDYRHITVSMALACYNKNFVGTQFGGSLFAMTDPFYMLMLLKNLGNEYYIWDKAAHIEFIKPGRSRVTAQFTLTTTVLDEIRAHTATGDKYFHDLPVDIFDEENELIARVCRNLYVRKKPQFRVTTGQTTEG